jgi:hypothetical protein
VTSIPSWLTRTVVGAALAAGAAGFALTLAGVNSPLRVPLLLLFLATAPAVAVAGLLRGFDPLAVLVIGGAATIAINTLVAATMLTLGVWSLHAGLLAVASITAVGLAGQVPSVRAVVTGRLPSRHARPERHAARSAGGRAPVRSRRARERAANAANQAAESTAGMRTDDATTQIGGVRPLRPARSARPATTAAPSPANLARQPTTPTDAMTAQFSVILPDKPAAATHSPAAQAPANRPDESASPNDAPTAQFPAVRPSE